MKKHIFGAAIFSLIVFAAAFIFALFNISENFSVQELASVPESYPSFTNYKVRISGYETLATVGKIDANSPVIKQAVFHKETNTLYLDLYENNSGNNHYDARLPLKFSFFRKDAEGTKLIAAEKYYLNSEYVRNNGTIIKEPISVSYDWLYNLNSYDNIYVIVEADSEYHNQKATSKFDPRFAKAVTIFLDETFLQIKQNYEKTHFRFGDF